MRAGDGNPAQLGYWTAAWLERVRDLCAAHAQLTTAWAQAPAPAPREAVAAAARLEEAGAAWDEAISVIDEARKKQMTAPGLQEPAKKALATLDREWDGLAAHRDYPMIGLDNNPAERALRRPVVTRKNAYGSRNEDAARLAARIWTVTATAQMAGLNVLTYLTASTNAAATTGSPSPARTWNVSCPGTPTPETSAPGHSRPRPDSRTGTAAITASPRTRSRRPLAYPITGLPITYAAAGWLIGGRCSPTPNEWSPVHSEHLGRRPPWVAWKAS